MRPRRRQPIEPDGRAGRLEGVEAIGTVEQVTATSHASAQEIELPAQSFVDFYRSAYADVARALQLTLGDRDLGVEAADEAMTRAYGRWSQVARYDNPRGWVYRVGLNYALSFRRRAARRLPWIEASTTDLPPTSDPALRAALEELDVKYRSVVVCRHLLDWSTEQTADALGIAPGTVKSRLSTAMTRLRDALAEPDPPAAPGSPHQAGAR